MKNLKFKVLSTLVAASILVPTLSVSAEEANTKAGIGSGLIRQQKALVNKDKLQNYKNSDEWKQYKASITSKKDTIKQNHETNQALRKEVANKKATIKNLNKDIKQNNKQLSADDLSKIEAQLQVLNADVSQLATLKGSIEKDFQTIKNDVKNKNFQDAEAQFDNIISIQNTRTDGLKKLSAELDTLINLIQTATANAKTI